MSAVLSLYSSLISSLAQFILQIVFRRINPALFMERSMELNFHETDDLHLNKHMALCIT